MAASCAARAGPRLDPGTGPPTVAAGLRARRRELSGEHRDQRCRRRNDQGPGAAARIPPYRAGIDDHTRRVVQPRRDRGAGERATQPQPAVRPVRRRECGRPDQRFRCIDETRHPAQSGPRVGDHRPAERAGQRGDRVRAHAGIGPDHDDPVPDGGEIVGRGRHRRGIRRGPARVRDHEGRAVGPARRVHERRAGRDQRVREREVQVHGPRPPRSRGCDRATCQGAPFGTDPRAIGGHLDRGEPAHRGPEESDLADGLGRPDVLERRRPVGGAHEKWHPAVVGLEHRRVQVRGRGTRGGEHHRRPAGGPADPERHERAGPLVEHHPDADPAVVRERQGQRGRARSRAHDCIAHAGTDQLVDERPGERGGRIPGHGTIPGCAWC